MKDIPSQPYEDELIVVTPSDSTMHTLSGVGPWIWSRLEGRTLQSVATELVEAFEVSPETAAKDVLNFASVLLGRGLVEIVPPDPDPVSS